MTQRTRILCLRLLVSVYLVSLWVDQILIPPFDKHQLNRSDVVLAAAGAVCALLFARDLFRLLRQPAVLLILALFASFLLSSTIHDGAPDLRPTGRMSLQMTLVALFAVVAAKDGEWFGRLAYWLAAGVIAVAALGFTAALLLDATRGQWFAHRPSFLVQDNHPVLGNWPRPVGGFGMAAEKFGVWAMVACAVLIAGAHGRGAARMLLAGVAGLLAAATLTISASGGLLFLPVWLHHRGQRKQSWGIAAVLIALLLVAQIPVHVVAHADDMPRGDQAIACLDVHPDHLARSTSNPETHETCRLLPAWDGALLTRYGLAKKHAWEVWSRSPLLGEGQTGFRQTARADVDDDGNPILWAYTSPHSALAGTAAEQGLVGLLLLLGFAVGLARALKNIPVSRARHALALSLALAGFAAAMISQDVVKERLFWAVAGYAIGLALEGRTDSGPSQQKVTS